MRSQESDWQRAGVILKSVFIEVQEQAKQQKQAMAEAKRAARQSGEVAAESPPVGPAKAEGKKRWSDPLGDEVPPMAMPQSVPKIDSGVPPRIRRSRKGLMAQLFGSTKPSPYWGFRFLGMLINVLIALVLLGEAISLVAFGSFGVTGFLAAEEAAFKAMALGVMLLYMLGSVLITVFWVGLLIFYRNLIDWLIDMQDHAAAIRSSLTGQPRVDT